MSTHGRQAIDDYSKSRRDRTDPEARPGGLVRAAAGLGLAGVVLAVAATFSTIIKIQVLTVTPASFSGYDRHSVALVVLAVFGLLMIAGALRGARPAMGALALCGLGVLLIAVLIDLPHLHDSGVWPLADQYEDAQARAGTGYYFETAAGTLMLLSGVLMLLLAPRPPRVRGARRRARPRAEPVAAAAGSVPADTPVRPSGARRDPEDWFAPDSPAPGREDP